MTPSGFLLIDKPAGWTSFDVVAKLRRTTGVKTIGHAGTLDPFATGLLIVAIGREATKRLDTFSKLDKTYQATFTLGATSTTQDPEGEITATLQDAVASSTPMGSPRNDGMNSLPSLEAIERAVTDHFTGTIDQIPPMHSAIKIGGKKLYELARQGKEIDRPARQVTIHRFDILEYDLARDGHARPLLLAELDVSSGTYVRAIARDLGNILGCGAYCSALRRTRIGEHSIDDAVTLPILTPENWPSFLLEF